MTFGQVSSIAVNWGLMTGLHTYSNLSFQSVQQRDRSTLISVKESVFPALVHVRNPTQFAPESAAVDVGVLLVQCLMNRLMLVSM